MSNVHSFDAHNRVQLLVVPASQGDVTTSRVEPFADGGSADRAVFMLVLGSSANTTDFKLQQHNAASGGTTKDITGAAITQLSTALDEVVVTIEIGPGAMDDVNGFKWVTAVTEIGGSDVAVYGVVYIRHRLRYPSTSGQHATYSQQIRVY